MAPSTSAFFENPYACHPKTGAGIFRYYRGTAASIMNTKIDPRSPAKKAKDAAYAKLGPALILKPLRYIAANTAKYPITGTTGEVLGYRESLTTQTAREWAKCGNGLKVKALARKIALA